MPTIKRYANRKLYDTEAKQYITLQGIAELIRQGEEIRVIDNTNGEDLTALTLTQIILEEEKKQSGVLPRSVLAGLIRAGSNRVSSLQRNIFSSVGLLHLVDDEIKRRIQELVHSGELIESDAQTLLEKLLNVPSLKSVENPGVKPGVLKHEIEQVLSERHIPTRDDLEQLTSQLEDLASKLDSLK
jgi:polyhydroxyalkanoate synthesis repressor PhaR